MKYQLAVLGPEASLHFQLIEDEVVRQICDLGLNATDIQVFTPATVGKVDFDGSPVCVWFGDSIGHGSLAVAGPGNHLEILRAFIDEGQPVLPLWKGSGSFTAQMPSELHKINGRPWRTTPDEQKEDIPAAAADILRAFRLTRMQRQCFISYRRAESRGVALQLFRELACRGYRPFLDTASVPTMADFQASLWGRMADVDVVVFLDADDPLASEWVRLELARAVDLGLGLLQLVWPGRRRGANTDLADHLELDAAELETPAVPPATVVPASPAPEMTLTLPGLQKVIGEIERTRIRSLRSRRIQVVGEVLDRARERNLDVVAHPVGAIELRDATGNQVGEVYPLVGLPDAMVLYGQDRDRERALGQATPAPLPWAKCQVTYLGLGVPDDWASHLVWLNALGMRLKVTQVDDLGTWMKTL